MRGYSALRHTQRPGPFQGTISSCYSRAKWKECCCRILSAGFLFGVTIAAAQTDAEQRMAVGIATVVVHAGRNAAFFL
jgi:hypothetical protein